MARSTQVDVVAVHGFPLDWNLWPLNAWPDKIAEIKAVTDKPVWVTEVGVGSFGAEEVQVFGIERTAELLSRPGAAHLLVFAVRPAAVVGRRRPATARRKARPITGISTWA